MTSHRSFSPHGERFLPLEKPVRGEETCPRSLAKMPARPSKPARREEMSFSSPRDRWSLFSPRSPTEASSPYGRWIGIIVGERRWISRFSLFFSFFFLLPRLISPNSGRQRSKSTITGRFQAVTRRN
ncbi:hypothetical protein GW17_00050231 [Ensete ventricosum]|nr:hypothetical protein GW17_00050231 [Ensete ventricosum]